MRFLHLADLHIGKILHGVSLLDSGDQEHWKQAFLDRVQEIRPDAVVIAGDIYDRSNPPGEAAAFLSSFLTELNRMGIPVMLTAGNHDSIQRLSFARELLAPQGLYISAALSGGPELVHVTLEDDHGPVTFWLMPYIFPALAEQAFPDSGKHSFDSAVRTVLSAQPVDFSQRNVLVAHQNVTENGKEVPRGGSESMVGGVGQVDYTAFDGFDYVALGHIHSGYKVGRDTVRYAGSPLCYHFEETKQQKKGCVLVDLGAKGEPPHIEVLSFPPLHPMRELRGPYGEVRQAMEAEKRKDEYLRIVLTDRRVTPEISDYFHSLCRERDGLLMELLSEYNPYRDGGTVSGGTRADQKPIEALFADFYTERFKTPPDEKDLSLFSFAAEMTRSREQDQNNPDDGDAEKLLAHLLEQEGPMENNPKGADTRKEEKK